MSNFAIGALVAKARRVADKSGIPEAISEARAIEVEWAELAKENQRLQEKTLDLALKMAELIDKCIS